MNCERLPNISNKPDIAISTDNTRRSVDTALCLNGIFV